MDPRRRWVVVLVGLVVLALLGAGAVPALGAHEAPIGQQRVDADAVSLRATVDADGSATWRVTYRVELDDENATDAFEEVQSEVASDPGPYLDRFGDRMNRTVRAAENATGRDMSIGNLSVRATRESLPQAEYGLLVYRLDWQGFAAVEGDQLRVGDAIDQLFLDERMSLTIAWPDRYAASSVEPEATIVDDGSATWQGRRDFGPGEPRVTLVRGTPTEDGTTTRGGRGLQLLGIGLLAAVVLTAGAWAFVRRRGSGLARGGHTDDTPDEPGAPGASEPPPELLSNEERVLRLLEERGGRMKQQEVSAELDWTDAKTSQVVGDLRDAGDLESFRLGRENVLTLPGVSIGPDDGEE